MKRIIAPTDFSPASTNAVAYAADLAVQLGHALTVVHICPLPLAYNEIPQTVNLSQMVVDAEKRMEVLLDSLKEKTSGKITVESRVLIGSVVNDLKQLCDELHPFALVMGTEQKSSFERALTGGYTIDSIRQLSQPVFVIPPDARFHGLKRIGIACDYKELEDTIPLEEIKLIVKTFDASLFVLNVMEGEARDDFNSRMVVSAGWLTTKLEDMKPVYDFISADKIDDGLNRYAEEKKLDLMIIVPKRHGLLGKLFLKSTSKQVVLHTHVPVMSIHE